MPESPPIPLDRLAEERAATGQRAGERFALLVCGLLGLYALYDAAVFYATPEQRVIYALAGAPVLLGGAAAMGAVALTRRAWMTVLLLVALTILPLATGLTRPGLHVDHLVGDLATILVPLAMLVAAAAAPGLRRDGPATRALLLLLVLAACIAPALGRNPSNRFEPPSPLLACAALTVFVHRRGLARAVAVAAYLLLLALVAGSGERTVLVAWLALPFAAFALRRGLLVSIALLAGVAATATVAMLLLPEDMRAQAARSLRVEEIAKGNFDSSLEERLEEVRDLGAEMRAWSALQWTVGAGHGACWRLTDATPHRQNVQADGTVHHVHITPVAAVYRYGALGALAVLLYLWMALRPYLSLRGNRATGGPAEAATFFQLGAAAYLWTALLTAALVDPLFSFVLAGRLLTGSRTAPNAPGTDRGPIS